jgi:hypothetical protein
MMEDDNLEEQIHPLVLVYLGDLADRVFLVDSEWVFTMMRAMTKPLKMRIS